MTNGLDKYPNDLSSSKMTLKINALERNFIACKLKKESTTSASGMVLQILVKYTYE